MSAVMQENRQYVLKKHINTIHCSNNLSLVQRKLFNALLFEAYPNLAHQTKFEIPVRYLCKLIGYNSNDYKGLKKSLLTLITTAIQWNVLDCITGKEDQWKASAILASAELINGLCLYEYSEVMRELLFQPDIYGRIDMSLIAKFKSSYGLALYENCIRYQGLKQTPWFPLDSFRKLMGVFENKYLAFKDFKKRVLVVAVEEVNALSPLTIEPEIERRNQKVTQIRFKLTKKKKNMVDTVDLQDNTLEAILLNVFNLSKPHLMEVKATYSEPYIQEKVDLILKSDSFLTGKIKTLSGYLMNALQKDYKAAKTSKQVIVEEQRRQQSIIEQKKADSNKELLEKHNAYVYKKVSDYLQSLTDKDLNKLREKFEKSINTEPVLSKYFRKHGLEHAMTRAAFHSFVRKENKEQLGNIISFDEFASIFSG